MLGIPTNRTITGHESQRLDFATAILRFIIKDPPTRKQMGEFVKSYAMEEGMLPKVCYAILKTLKDQTIVRYDENFKTYSYNRHRYHRDQTALKAFHEQVKAWNKTSIYY